MIRTTALAIAAVAVAACSSKGEPPPPSSTGSAPGSGPGSAAPVPPAVADAAPATGDAPLADHMRLHFAAASDLQRAIARGHLDQAKQDARWLVEHDDARLAAWQPFVERMRRAAREVTTAPDLPTAAVHAATLGRTCSRCHEATTAVVTFAWAPPPDDDPALASQMKRHQWAAARLWEGLVGPSEELWSQGATTLSALRLDAVAAAGGAARGDIPALAARVRELAGRATTLTDQDARATLYGELLSTCAGCHTLVRPAPVPGP